MDVDDLTETQAKSILDRLAKRCGFNYVSHDGYAIIFSNMSLSYPSLRNGVFLKPGQCLESILVELDLGVMI